MSFTREQIIEMATEIHDKNYKCKCDPKYIMSCPKMAEAILLCTEGK